MGTKKECARFSQVECVEVSVNTNLCTVLAQSVPNNVPRLVSL